MLNSKIEDNVLRLTRELKDVPGGRNKHFSFIFRRSNLISIGWNTFDETHPKAKLCGYRYDDIHSELSAIIRYRGTIESLRKCILVNTRINRFGTIRISKPCDKCMQWLPLIGFREIWHTNYYGQFEQLVDADIEECKPSLLLAIS